MKKWSFLIKFLISALLLVLVIKLVDLHNLLEKLQKVNLGIILLLICGYSLAQILSAFKWWLITKSSFPNKPFSDALSSYYMGMFINIFGLGMIGGDLSRAVFFAQERSKVIKAVGTVAADRIHGLLILVLIGFLSLILFKYDTSIQNVHLLLVGIAFLFILGWFFATHISNFLLKFFPKLKEQFQRLFSSFPKDFKTLALISLISAIFHTVQILLHGLMSFGLGETIPLTALFCFIPLVNIFSSLPISWMGLGIREVSYVFFLTPAFVSKESAIAFGAIWFFANISSSIIGGLLVYWIKGFQIQDVRNILAKDDKLNQIEA